MSDGLTDSHWTKDMRLGGPIYCEKCGKYHPMLPFCPSSRVPSVPKSATLPIPRIQHLKETIHNFVCAHCEVMWSVSEWEPVDIVCCPQCGEPHRTGHGNDDVFSNVDLKGWVKRYM